MGNNNLSGPIALSRATAGLVTDQDGADTAEFLRLDENKRLNVSANGAVGVADATIARPADTTAYTIGDLIANSTSSGSVTPISISSMRYEAGGGVLRRLRLITSNPAWNGKTVRVHVFNSAPVVNVGDNSPIGTAGITGVSKYVTWADITFSQAFSDGAWGCTDSMFIDSCIKLAAGQVIYALLEDRSGSTPESGQTFSLVAETLQD